MVWGIWGKKGKNERGQDRAKKIKKAVRRFKKNALFAPAVLLSIKIKKKE